MGKKGPLWWRESDWLLRGSSAANQILLRHSGPILSAACICGPGLLEGWRAGLMPNGDFLLFIIPNRLVTRLTLNVPITKETNKLNDLNAI